MSMEMSYHSIRSANQAREADEERTISRKRNLLVLILHYLHDEGYLDSAAALETEATISLARYDVCDNIDLETVLQEYESYYYVKFNKYPKVVKRVTESAPEAFKSKHKRAGHNTSLPRIPGGGGGGCGGGGASQRPNSGPANYKKNSATVNGRGGGGGGGEHVNGSKKDDLTLASRKSKHAAVTSLLNGHSTNHSNSTTNHSTAHHSTSSTTNSSSSSTSSAESGAQALAALVISPCKSSADFEGGGGKRHRAGTIVDVRGMINDATRLNVEEGFEERLMKPLGGYLGVNQEMRDLATAISRDIYLHNPNVRWDDIIGLQEAKRLVKEAVVYPIKYPQLFTGILSPWKGLLLYGPPGTGKTLLAKAVATECQTTFFNISASSIVSKWRGDSEKLVRVLFEMARYHAPSTIFLDELESVMSQRGSSGGVGEHEGSRRMKTELLVQMDGLSRSEDLVFVLAASNLPWELDHAMLRRLEKRILVDLPNAEARGAMLRHYLPPVVCGRDQNGLTLESRLDYPRLATKTEGYSGADIKLVCKEAAMGAVRKVFDVLENAQDGDHLATIQLDVIETSDVEGALARTKPSARLLQGKYEAWQKEYESV